MCETLRWTWWVGGGLQGCQSIGGYTLGAEGAFRVAKLGPMVGGGGAVKDEYNLGAEWFRGVASWALYYGDCFAERCRRCGTEYASDI